MSSKIAKLHPEATLPDFSKPDITREVHKGANRIHVWQQWKTAASSTKVGDDYSYSPRNGCYASSLASLQRGAGNRLVDGILSCRQYAASHRTAMRRVPFSGELQCADENSNEWNVGG